VNHYLHNLNVHGFSNTKYQVNTGLDIRTNGSFHTSTHLSYPFFNNPNLSVNAHSGSTLKGFDVISKQAIFWNSEKSVDESV